MKRVGLGLAFLLLCCPALGQLPRPVKAQTSDKEKESEPKPDLNAAIPTWRGMFGGGVYVPPASESTQPSGGDVVEMKSASGANRGRGGMLNESQEGSSRPRVHGDVGVSVGPGGTGRHGTVVIEPKKGPAITLSGESYSWWP